MRASLRFASTATVLLLVAAHPLLPSAPASAATLVVDPAGGGHATIASALAAAAAGDVILVRPGTYAEAVTITKGVTLCSAPAGAAACSPVAGVTAIESPGLAGVTIRANNVELRGFTIRVFGAGIANAVTMGGGGYSNVRVLDNVIPAPMSGQPGESGIVGRFTNGLVAGNDVAGYRQGLYLTPYGKDTVVRDNTFHQDGEGVLVYSPGTLLEGNRFEGNILRGIGVGVIPGESAAHRTVLRDNRFAGNPHAIAFRTPGPDPAPAVTVDARENDWSVYTRAAIQALIDPGPTGATVDVACFVDADGTTKVCPPVPGIQATPNPVSWKREVQFRDVSTPNGRPIVERSWDFGDDNRSTEAAPRHAYATPGFRTVVLTVKDVEGYVATATANIVVVNHAPKIAAIGAKNVSEGETLDFPVSATDEDGDAVTLRAENLPAGATFAGGRFRYTPDHDAAGSRTVRFTATDGDATTTEDVSITILDVDRAPVFSPIAPRTVDVYRDRIVRFTVFAADPDGGAAAIRATSLPAGASFEPANRTFWWSPEVGDAGRTHVASFEAESNGLLATADALLIVTANANPRLAVRNDGAWTATTSPGAPVTFRFVVTNTGALPDAVSLAGSGPAGWTTTVGTETLELASGESAVVTMTVVPTANPSNGAVTLAATSAAGARATGAAVVKLPVVLTLVLDAASFGVMDTVKGTVVARFLDGAPAAKVSALLEERANALPGARGGTYATGEDGAARFAFAASALGANSPGTHQVIARPLRDGTAASATYTVGLR